MKKIILLPIIAILFVSFVVSPFFSEPREKKIMEALQRLQNFIPFQRIYVHFDRNSYNTNEIIWYKTYILNSTDNKCDSTITNLYIELIDPLGRQVRQQILKPENGMASGNIFLSDTVPSGKYLFRAYTNLLRNYGEDYFFSKEIFIENNQRSAMVFYANSAERRSLRKIEKDKNIFDIQFLPEGGTFVNNIESRMAFVCTNKYGEDAAVSGVVKDDKGTEIVKFTTEHNGMGSFYIKPQSGRKYVAVVTFENGKTEKIKLPEAEEVGITMKVSQKEDNTINVTVKTNRPPSLDLHSSTVILACQSGHKMRYMKSLVLNDSVVFSVPLDSLPTGVAQFTIFDGELNPRCERLWFVNNYDFLQAKIQDMQFSQIARSKNSFNLLITDHNGTPVEANLSVSVKLKSENETVADNDNFITRTYLTSDLRGRIKNPQYYFQVGRKNSEAADLLMLTHGWRKFSWKEILEKETYTPEFENENYLTVSGQIVRDFFDIPVPDADVHLTILSEYNDTRQTTANENGEYEFSGLKYNDTIEVMVEAFSSIGKKTFIVVKVDEAKPTENNYLAGGTENLGKYIAVYEIPTHESKEGSLHSYADNVIVVTENDGNNYRTVLDLLQAKVSGLRVSGSSVFIRGSNSPATVLVDNVPVESSYLASLSVRDVARVEVIKGSSAAIYGSHGGSGVIAVHTKEGYNIVRYLVFKMLGYHTVREFYSPNYETLTNSDSFTDNRRTLLWLPQLTTNKDGMVSIEFFQPDVAGELQIIVEGTDMQGNILSTVFE